MKTLLQINSVVSYGSTGRIVEELGRTAIANDWVSYIAHGRNQHYSKSKLFKIGTDRDIKLHGLKTRLFDRHGLGSKKATIKLIEQVENIKPDIIHLHNIHGYYLNIDVLFKYLSHADIPVVWTLHDCWAITGHCSSFALIGCEKWKTECYACPQKKVYPGSILFDRSRQNYYLKKQLFTSVKNLTIIPVSHWLGELVAQSFLSKFPIRVINNGIDLEIFSLHSNAKEVREKYGIGTRYMLMGVATSWSERKGLEDYIKLSKALPDECIIVLVGLSKPQLKRLPPTIIGIARTENIVELSKLYSAANIILNLSYEESFGLTTVEGFACGTPCIGYNCTATPDLITSTTGLVVKKGDINGLIDAIKTIKTKGKNYYRSACRNRAKRLFDKNDRYLDYLKLYKSFLNYDW